MTNKNINFGADLLPETDSTYDLGTSSKEWNNIYASNLYLGDVDVSSKLSSIGTSTGGSVYGYDRFIGNTETTQSLTTSAAAVTAIATADGTGNAGNITAATTGIYTIKTAGTYRIKATIAWYPNTTAAQRIAIGLYDTNASGTRLAFAGQRTYGVNSVATICTVDVEYVGVFAASAKVCLAAYGSVTSQKVRKDFSTITFERMA